MSREHGIIGPCSECQAIRDQVALEARIRADEREAVIALIRAMGAGDGIDVLAAAIRARGSKP